MKWWSKSKPYRGWVALGLLVIFCLWFFKPIAIWRLRTHNPRSTSFIELRRHQARAQNRSFHLVQVWIPLSKIAKSLQQAVLAAEDDNFFQHSGLDFNEIWQSAKTNIQRREYALGGSTITQQVAKNLFLSPRKTLPRKMHEAVLALELDWFLGKPRVLEIYLNIAEWGRGIFGAEAAAQAYFHKSAAELTQAEAVDLVAVLPSPLRHSPLKDSRYLQWRRVWVKRQMHLVEPDTLASARAVSPTADAVSATITAGGEADFLEQDEEQENEEMIEEPEEGRPLPDSQPDTESATGEPELP